MLSPLTTPKLVVLAKECLASFLCKVTSLSSWQSIFAHANVACSNWHSTPVSDFPT
uniref:Uncharacterized protein n=1 Tax=Anguilla anguilla TaxID=7936 RepID=A0A0E9RAH1_ANGAN